MKVNVIVGQKNTEKGMIKQVKEMEEEKMVELRINEKYFNKNLDDAKVDGESKPMVMEKHFHEGEHFLVEVKIRKVDEKTFKSFK